MLHSDQVPCVHVSTETKCDLINVADLLLTGGPVASVAVIPEHASVLVGNRPVAKRPVARTPVVTRRVEHAVVIGVISLCLFGFNYFSITFQTNIKVINVFKPAMTENNVSCLTWFEFLTSSILIIL